MIDFSSVLGFINTIITTLGPVLMRLLSASASGQDPVAELSKERVATILSEQSRIEVAQAAAHLRAVHTTGKTAEFSVIQLKLVEHALSLHDLILST